MKPIVSVRERAWRNRNPSLAAKFDRLSAGAKANIRTNGFGKGTADLTKLADEYRRQDVRARSQGRRTQTRTERDWGYTKARVPQPRKYRVWMVDEFTNVRAVADYHRAPGDVIGQYEYRESRYKDQGLHVVAVTVR